MFVVINKSVSQIFCYKTHADAMTVNCWPNWVIKKPGNANDESGQFQMKWVTSYDMEVVGLG